MNKRRALGIAGVGALVAGVLTMSPASAAPPSGKAAASVGQLTVQNVLRSGTASLSSAVTSRAAASQSVDRASIDAAARRAGLVNRSLSRRPGTAKAPAAAPPPPAVAATPVSAATPDLVQSFRGLNHVDQRSANGGNQFSLEPPDQGLCAGNGFVLETVNDVLRVYGTDGTPQSAATDLNTFYGYPAQVDRTTLVSGPALTDPSCYYDEINQRWYHVVLTLDTNPDGSFRGSNHLDLAVSQASSPLGAWAVYQIPAQDDGTQGTPNHNCAPQPSPPPTPTVSNPSACFGDYPHVGADRNGFYITTNEYDFFGPNFTTAQLYSISRQKLATAPPSIQVLHFDHLGLAGTPGFTVWPAQSAHGEYSDHLNGSEYFLSSMAAGETGNTTGAAGSIGIWQLSNTASLNTATPSLQLANAVLSSELYEVPAFIGNSGGSADQKVGDVPLVQCVNDPLCNTGLFGNPPDPAQKVESESTLDGSDTRILSAWFTGNQVWGTLDTAVSVGGQTRVGIAWFAVQPNQDLTTSPVSQGYLGVGSNNAIFGTVAALADGRAVLAMTLVGPDYFPSAAYAFLSQNSGVSAVNIAGAGKGPSDGFSGTWYFNNPPGTPETASPRPRWGDYGAVVILGDAFWLASEYIDQTCTYATYWSGNPATSDPSCGQTRTALANWATRITEVTPPFNAYTPVTPARITDTRPGSGDPNAGATLGPGATLDIQVTGAGGVPSGATSAVLNLTDATATADSYLSVWPKGQPKPTISNLNFGPGQVRANLVQVALGSGGAVSIFNNKGSTDVVVDAEGYVAPSSQPGFGFLTTQAPARIADTRPSSGQPNAGQTLGPGASLSFQVTGALSGIPSTGVSAVVLNVTEATATAPSFLTAYGTGTARPKASNLNFTAGQIVPNRVIVPVGAGGQVTIYNNQGSTDVVIDANGWFSDGSNPAAFGGRFQGAAPGRITDTRLNSGYPNQGATLGPGGTLNVATGAGGAPSAATTAVLNVTVTNPTAAGYLTVYPAGGSVPFASDLNWDRGGTVPNLDPVRLGSQGQVGIHNTSIGSADVVVDLFGWYVT